MFWAHVCLIQLKPTAASNTFEFKKQPKRNEGQKWSRPKKWSVGIRNVPSSAPRCWHHPQLQYGKVFILLLAAAAALAVLTQEREISTCPHRIPGPVPSTTYLLSSLPPLELGYNFFARSLLTVVVGPQSSWFIESLWTFWGSLTWGDTIQAGPPGIWGISNASWIIWQRTSK